MNILAIDQGPESSGVTIWDTEDWAVLFAEPAYNNAKLLSHLSCRLTKRKQGLRFTPQGDEFPATTWDLQGAGHRSPLINMLILERFSSYGSTMGATTIDSIRYGGMFAAAAHANGLAWKDIGWMSNATWRSMIAGRAAATESQTKEAMRQMLMDHMVQTGTEDRMGGGKMWWKGIKAKPGPLVHIKDHSWSALGLAMAMQRYLDAKRRAEELGTAFHEPYPLAQLNVARGLYDMVGTR